MSEYVEASGPAAGEQAIIEQLLIETLDKSHPVVTEGILLAAVPFSYDLPLLTNLRQRDDGNDERLYSLLASLPYVEEQRPGHGQGTRYAVRPRERQTLHSQFIKRDRAGYLATHERALAHWREDLAADHFVQTQNTIYHQLIVDSQEQDPDGLAGISALISTFRTYINDRHLAATDRLLEMAGFASYSLEELGAAWTGELDQLLILLRARLAQFHGDWDQSRQGLEQLGREPNLWPPIAPYLTRIYGYDLAHDNDFASAIDQYKTSLKAFQEAATAEQTGESLARTTTAEIGLTMIALGDAHLELGRSVRGRRKESEQIRQTRNRVVEIFNYIRALPVLVYLSFYFGLQVWDRAILAAIGDEDWIIIRLLATAVRWYLQAGPHLEGDKETRSDRALSEERLAFLLLEIGAADQASGIFRELLQEDTASQSPALSPYRRARAQLGLGESTIQLGRAEEAVAPLKLALDELNRFVDEPLAPRANQALGEAWFEVGETSQSVEHFAAAIHGFQEQEDWTATTTAAERLQSLMGRADIAAPVHSGATATVEGLPCRQYQVRFQHPRLKRFRRLMILLVPLVIILIPLATIRLDSSTHISPAITFKASPILNLDEVESSALVEVKGQAVKATNIAEPPDPELILWVGLFLFASYLFFSLLFGVLAIVSTSLRTVQNLGREATILLDDEGIGTRLTSKPKWLTWPTVRKVVLGDTLLNTGLIRDRSSFTLLTSDDRLEVPSSTDWYRSLRRTTDLHLAAGGVCVDLDYDLWRSRAGLLYAINVLLLALVAILVAIAPQLIWRDIPGLRYSIGDLYPYLYVGLVILPLWWGVVRRLRVRRHMKPRTRYTWWVLGAGLLAVVFQIIVGYRPLLTPVNVIIPLATLLLLVSAGSAVWRAEQAEQKVYPLWQRIAVLLIVLVSSLLMLAAIVRDVGAYHYRVTGDYYRDWAQTASVDERQATSAQALASYERSVALSRDKIPQVDAPRWARQILGVPRIEQFTEVSALLGQAAMQMQLRQYQEAVDSFSEILNWTNVSGQIFAWRGQARQGLADEAQAQGQEEVGAREFTEAIYDYDRAIGSAPKAEYYLGRGVAQNTRGDVDGALESYRQALQPEDEDAIPLTGEQKAQAQIGQAWLWHDAGQHPEALAAFSDATKANPRSVEAWLGLGYAQYALDQFDDALVSWEEAQRLDPQEPVVLISLGTLHWKYGGISRDNDSAAACQSYDRSAEYFIQAADENGTLKPQLDVERAFTYRTLGQVQFLLDRCTEHPTQALQDAVDSYSRAVDLDPENAVYWLMRGRLNYALWFVDPETGAVPRARLFVALDDLDTAIRLRPNDDPATGYEPNRWKETRIVPAAIGGTLQRAGERFAEGSYQEAFDYYELLANNVEDNADYAFKAGLAALAIGDETGAITWYEAGIERAMVSDEAGAIRRAWRELNDYLAENERPSAADVVASLLQETGVSLLSAEDLVGQALSAFEAGRQADALATYAEALNRAGEDGDTAAVWSGQQSFYMLSDPEFMVDLNALVVDAWPDLESAVAGDEAIREAFDLALIAVLMDDGDAAGKWFNEGIRRTKSSDFNPILRRVGRFEMRELWQLAVELELEIGRDFIAEMDAQLPALLEECPEFEDDGDFWRYRGWFKYYVGLAVFHAGDETFAREALDSGQPDADRAAELGAAGSFAIHTYLPEGAWGWYHIERADVYYEDGELASALDYYEKAAEFYMPDENATALQETAQAAFLAARTAVALADFDLAQSWYDEGLARASVSGNEETLITEALNKLLEVLEERPELEEQAMPLREMLE